MKPFFLVYKSITITWFMLLASISFVISYFIVKTMAKKYGEEEHKIEDIFIILLIVGFIGARLSYFLMNFQLYKDNIFSIFILSHYNLSLIGGIIFSLLALVILSKIYKISFHKLLRIFVIAFYFSMAIGIWYLMFEGFLLPVNYIKNGLLKIICLSFLFLLGIILELILSKRVNSKYITFAILSVVILSYYII